MFMTFEKVSETLNLQPLSTLPGNVIQIFRHLSCFSDNCDYQNIKMSQNLMQL